MSEDTHEFAVWKRERQTALPTLSRDIGYEEQALDVCIEITELAVNQPPKLGLA